MVRVSVVIPCRNERDYIARSLDSVLANDYPREDVEILVVDGMSDDGTRRILRAYRRRVPRLRLLDNPARSTAAGLNIGVRRARGSVIVRMDAHNVYDRHYISRSVRYLDEYGVDNVGGLWVTRPGADTRAARAIALASSHRFGVGNARYRTGARGPMLVDTVPFGCYRREVFDRIGLFDPGAPRTEDDEFNLRLVRSGGRILLAPDIVSYYYARPDYPRIWRMFYQYGLYKPLVFRKTGTLATLRQTVPPLFLLSLAASGVFACLAPAALVLFSLVAGAYLVASAAVSLTLAARHGPLLFPYLVAAFAAGHAGYGLGYLEGMFRFWLLRRDAAAGGDIPLTR